MRSTLFLGRKNSLCFLLIRIKEFEDKDEDTDRDEDTDNSSVFQRNVQKIKVLQNILLEVQQDVPPKKALT